jgi:homoserine acetyltransferase
MQPLRYSIFAADNMLTLLSYVRCILLLRYLQVLFVEEQSQPDHTTTDNTQPDNTKAALDAAADTTTATTASNSVCEASASWQLFSVHPDEYSAIKAALDTVAAVVPLSCCGDAMRRDGSRLSYLLH